MWNLVSRVDGKVCIKGDKFKNDDICRTYMRPGGNEKCKQNFDRIIPRKETALEI